jgi:hypothetical protein
VLSLAHSTDTNAQPSTQRRDLWRTHLDKAVPEVEDLPAALAIPPDVARVRVKEDDAATGKVFLRVYDLVQEGAARLGPLLTLARTDTVDVATHLG